MNEKITVRDIYQELYGPFPDDAECYFFTQDYGGTTFEPSWRNSEYGLHTLRYTTDNPKIRWMRNEDVTIYGNDVGDFPAEFFAKLGLLDDDFNELTFKKNQEVNQSEE